MRAFRSRSRPKVILTNLALVLLAAGVGWVGFHLYEFSACSRGERSALNEIPQLTTEPQEPNVTDDGSCALFYDTDSPAEEVVAHYRQQFGAKGWRIVRDGPNPNSSNPNAPDMWSFSAAKDSYTYDVMVPGFPNPYTSNLPGVRLYVQR